MDDGKASPPLCAPITTLARPPAGFKWLGSIAEHLVPWPSTHQDSRSAARAEHCWLTLFKRCTLAARGHGKGDDEGLGSFETNRYAYDGIDEVRYATLQRAKTTSGCAVHGCATFLGPAKELLAKQAMAIAEA